MIFNNPEQTISNLETASPSSWSDYLNLPFSNWICLTRLVFEKGPSAAMDLKNVDNMSRTWGSEPMKLRLISCDYQEFFVLNIFFFKEFILEQPLILSQFISNLKSENLYIYNWEKIQLNSKLKSNFVPRVSTNF